MLKMMMMTLLNVSLHLYLWRIRDIVQHQRRTSTIYPIYRLACRTVTFICQSGSTSQHPLLHPRRAFSAHDFPNNDPPLMSRSASLPVQGYYGDQWPLSYSSYGGQFPVRSPTPSSDISGYSHLHSGHDVTTQYSIFHRIKAFILTTCW